MTQFPSELLSGYSRFRTGSYLDDRERFEQLAETGQNPSVMMIGCCDSRSAPEMIFNASPGELFVVRNVANLVPEYGPNDGFHSTSAALEFAVLALGVAHVVVMGHWKCGGISAALDPDMEPLSDDNFIGNWKEIVRPTAEKIANNETISAEEKQIALERASIRKSVENLRTYPFVADLEKRGKLELHGAWFDISTGELLVMDSNTGTFNKVPDGAV
ncbi:MAG: carbonic anhydrase [Pseudomonadota bacterium]